MTRVATAANESVLVHVARHTVGRVDSLVLRNRVSRDRAELATVHDVFAGATWHERETHEMFGIGFRRGGAVVEMEKLLLPEEFEGHPLRKEFVLASRVAKPWPGAKEPGESDHAPAATTSRRRARPPGVPTPDEWGPRPAADPSVEGDDDA